MVSMENVSPAQMKTLELYFEALRAHAWDDLASCLSEGVHRTGPYLDVIRGKQAYVDFLSRVLPSLRDYELEVSRVRAFDGRSVLAELSETLEVDGVRTEFPEALLFDFDEQGLIRRVDIYIKQPPPPPGS
jgi:hypothetical protein